MDSNPDRFPCPGLPLTARRRFGLPGVASTGRLLEAAGGFELLRISPIIAEVPCFKALLEAAGGFELLRVLPVDDAGAGEARGGGGVGMLRHGGRPPGES